MHFFYPSKYIIKAIGCSSLCLRRRLWSILCYGSKSLNFIISVASFFCNFISCNLRCTGAWTGNASFTQIMVCSLIGSSLCITGRPLRIFTLTLDIRDIGPAQPNLGPKANLYMGPFIYKY